MPNFSLGKTQLTSTRQQRKFIIYGREDMEKKKNSFNDMRHIEKIYIQIFISVIVFAGEV